MAGLNPPEPAQGPQLARGARARAPERPGPAGRATSDEPKLPPPAQVEAEEARTAERIERMQGTIAETISLVALVSGLDSDEQLDSASASNILDRCDDLLRVTRSALVNLHAEQKEGNRELRGRVARLNDALNEVRVEIEAIDARRAQLALEVSQHEAGRFDPQPFASLGLRVGRLAVATVLGSLIGGPAAALALGDQIVSKVLEGAIGGLIGGIGSETTDWITVRRENRMRERERLEQRNG